MIQNYKNNYETIRGINPIYIVDNPLISTDFTIVIPTYKRIQTLKDTIDSIIKQNPSRCPFNILISDNNTNRNDETERYVVNHHSHQKGLSYCKYSNDMNVADHWNKIFEICKTKYLIMLHDDDIALPNFFNDILEALDKNKDASYLKSGSYNWNGESFNVIKNKNNIYKETLNSLFYHFSLSPTGCLIKVKDVIDVGGYDIYWYPAIDYVLVLKLLLKGKSIYKTNKKSILYRRVNNDTSNPNTQLKLCEKDLKIKDELGAILSLPHWYIYLSKWFCRGSHIYYYNYLTTKKKNISYRFFFALYNIWNWFHKLYHNKKTLIS